MTAVQTSNVIAALPPWGAALVWILAIGGAVVFVYRRITGAGKPEPVLEDDPSTSRRRATRQVRPGCRRPSSSTPPRSGPASR